MSGKFHLFVCTILLAVSSLSFADEPQPGSVDNQILTELQALRQQLSELAQRVERVEKGVNHIGRMVYTGQQQGQQRSRPREVKMGSVPMGEVVYGDPNAPLVAIEFTDLDCPFCRKFHKETLPQIKRELIDPGHLRYAVKDLPLQMHPLAREGSHAVRCAMDQGKDWEMRDQLLGTVKKLTKEAMHQSAVAAGADIEQWQRCMDSGTHYAAIDADTKLAEGIGIRGTPTFLIGRLGPDGMVRGKIKSGSLTYDNFRIFFDAATEGEKEP